MADHLVETGSLLIAQTAGLDADFASSAWAASVLAQLPLPRVASL
jgi:hypothetical protein